MEIKTTPRPRYLRETDPVHILQEAVWGPTVGVDGCEKCRLHRESITGTFSPWRVPTQTELSRLQRGMITVVIFMKSLSFMILHFEAYCLKSMGRPTIFVQYIREENCAVCNQIIFRRQITPMFLLSCPWTWHMYRIESLHLPGDSVSSSMLRDTIKGTLLTSHYTEVLAGINSPNFHRILLSPSEKKTMRKIRFSETSVQLH